MKHLKNAIRVTAIGYYVAHVDNAAFCCAYYVPSNVPYGQIIDYIRMAFDVERFEIKTYSPNEWAKLSAIEDTGYYLSQKCILDGVKPSATHIMGGYCDCGEWVQGDCFPVSDLS